MNKTLKSLYAKLQRLQSEDNPSEEEIARAVYSISQEKAKLARSERPPEHFGADMHPLKEFIRRTLKEYKEQNSRNS